MLEKGYDFLLIQSAGNGVDGERTEARWNSALSYLQDGEIRSRILVVGAAGIHDDGTYYQAPFSNGGGRVDLLAPGVDIFCAVPGGYGRVSGSSPAAAHVSGVCASVLAAKPEMSCAQVRELVVNTADIPVPEGDAPMVNMRAVMETAGAVPYKPAEDPAEDEG
jgi:subtilisin family serine protease